MTPINQLIIPISLALLCLNKTFESICDLLCYILFAVQQVSNTDLAFLFITLPFAFPSPSISLLCL